jgi:hypothetical protein
MKKFMFITFLLLTLFASFPSFAQNDSIVFTNGNYMVGEIKKLELGVLQFETDYSDSDFLIDWELIKYIKSEQIFLITTSDGGRYNGSFESTPGDGNKLTIHDIKGGDYTVNLVDITFVKSVDQTFVSRLDLLLSAGYTLTKANNNNQFNARASIGYSSNTFAANAYANSVENFQEEVQDSTVVKINTKRFEAGAGLKFFIVSDWFAMVNSDLLQSTEQQLDLRSVTKGGIGNLIIQNQRMYLLAAIGAAWNYEDYTNPEPMQVNPRNSAEGYLGIEYRIYDLGDLKVNTSIYGYPSFTEAGRFRSDFLFDIRYEFAFDLFFGVGFTLNYDSKPASGSEPTDYVLQTSIGWEL